MRAKIVKKHNNNVEVFYTVLRAGLWEKDVLLSSFESIDFYEVYRLAEEQSVLGLMAAGIEHVKDYRIPQDITLQFVGQTIQLEQRNQSMNHFIVKLISKLRAASVYTLLVKGQGVAQCYERPLWRTCGDIDLFLSEENYYKAKQVLKPLAQSVENEVDYDKHLGMTIGSWVVELHGNLRSGLSRRIDKCLDSIKHDTFYNGYVRSWINDSTTIFLLGVNNDVIYVFSHILQHFYKGGVGLRQICDWCRLLWFNRERIDKSKILKSLKEMGLVTEWKAFGAYAHHYLGMPIEAIPLYDDSEKWVKKANRINIFILQAGNFGHNRDTSYYSNYSYLRRKAKSMAIRFNDLLDHVKLFPLNALKFFPLIVYNGFRSAFKGE